MKAILLAISLCFLFSFTQAQTPAGDITISGKLVDSITNAPLSYATAVLQDAKTKTPVKSILSKEDGSFTLTAPQGKLYQLVLAYVGYNNKTLSLADSNKSVDVGRIKLSPATKKLSEVSITAVKPLMKQEVDRISYDVQADPDAKVITALDMMRKVPLLSVDATDNIKLRGSGSYKILINGKESAMLANNPSDILKAMPATNILKIEVITTPPAKYDAEGLAGIINIITKKNADQGYNGSANANYNTVQGYRVNLNLTVKEGKFGYAGYLGGGNRATLGTDFGDINSFNNAAVASLLQTGTKFNGGSNVYNANELSYEIDTLNLISASFNHFKNNSTQGNNQTSTLRDANGNLTEAYQTINNGTSSGTGTDLGLNYQLGFKRNKDELLTASYRYNSFAGPQFNDVTVTDIYKYNSPNYLQYNTSGSKEYTTQLDYIEPLKVVTIEAGGKMILRDNYSNFQTDTAVGPNQYNTNKSQTNDFIYHQNVYSLYNSYQLKFTKWVFKGGLRLERTTVNANFSSAGGILQQGYNNLVPSFSAQDNLTATTNLTFGFTQRIQRPGISQLNPFVNEANPQSIVVGNPTLRPSLNNNFELSYGNFAKGSLNISTHYSFSNNTIEELNSVNAAGVTTTTYANAGQNKTLGIDLNANYPVTKKLNVNVNAELLQVWLLGTYNGEDYSNSGQQGHIFTFSSYKFDSGWRIGVNVGFDSRYVLLEGRDNWYFNNGYILSKEFFDGKGSFSATMANPFSQYNKLDFFTKTPDFQSYSYNFNHYRNFGIGFNYRFGQLKAAIKKNQRGINNDDTSGGGRN